MAGPPQPWGLQVRLGCGTTARLELQWDYYGPFGFSAVLAEADEEPYPLDMRVTAELLLEKEVGIVGTADEVAEKIIKLKEQVGYDDFLFTCWFEIGGFSGEEIEEQMHMFASDVTPQIAEACGGQVVNPEIGLEFAAPQTAAVT